MSQGKKGERSAPACVATNRGGGPLLSPSLPHHRRDPAPEFPHHRPPISDSPNALPTSIPAPILVGVASEAHWEPQSKPRTVPPKMLKCVTSVDVASSQSVSRQAPASPNTRPKTYHQTEATSLIRLNIGNLETTGRALGSSAKALSNVRK